MPALYTSIATFDIKYFEFFMIGLPSSNLDEPKLFHKVPIGLLTVNEFRGNLA